MPVGELLARTSSRELSEWAAYERIAGPLGSSRADLQAGIIAATVANANRSKGKPSTPTDFIPEWDRRPMSPEDLFRKVSAANRAFGGVTRHE